jgi:hypothetical protein
MLRFISHAQQFEHDLEDCDGAGAREGAASGGGVWLTLDAAGVEMLTPPPQALRCSSKAMAGHILST